MERNSRKPDLETKKISREELTYVSGGELTEEEKKKWWEKIRRAKAVMTKEDCLSRMAEGEAKDYVRSIWDDVPPIPTEYHLYPENYK